MIQHKLSSTTLTWLLRILIAFSSISITLLCLVPPVSRDALIHHLAIPKLYIQHGKIYEMPELPFSYYPMNLDMLYMLPLLFNLDVIPKLIHFSFSLLTGFIIYIFLIKYISKFYAYLGFLFFITTPIIIKLSITAYVDLGLVFFSTSSLFLIANWLEHQHKTKYLVLAGIFCGLAVGTKYNGLITFFLIFTFLPVLYLRTVDHAASTARAIKASIVFAITTILTASPWFIRNIHWKSNPIYPLYDNIIRKIIFAEPVASHETNSIQGVFALRKNLYGEDLWQILLLPIRIFFEGADNNPYLFDGQLNSFLLLLPLFAFLTYNYIPEKFKFLGKFFITFCILYLLFAFNSTALRIRYLAPIIPLLVVISIFGLYNVNHALKKHVKNKYISFISSIIFIIAILSQNATYIYKQFKIVRPVDYLTQSISRDEYLSKHLNEYEIYLYANTHLSKKSRILCVFLGWRGYHLEIDHVFDHRTNENYLLALLKKKGATTDLLIQHLQSMNFSHIIIRNDLFNVWIQKRPKAISLFNQLVQMQNIKAIKSENNYTLYEILRPIPYI